MKTNVTFLLCFLSALAHSQDRQKLKIEGITYRNGAMSFSCRNQTDSTISLFLNGLIVMKGNDFIRFFNFKNDTLIINLDTPGHIGEVQSNAPVKYHIDGDLYNRRKIAPGQKITLAISMKRKFYAKMRYIKLVPPDNDEAIIGVR